MWVLCVAAQLFSAEPADLDWTAQREREREREKERERRGRERESLPGPPAPRLSHSLPLPHHANTVSQLQPQHCTMRYFPKQNYLTVQTLNKAENKWHVFLVTCKFYFYHNLFSYPTVNKFEGGRCLLTSRLHILDRPTDTKDRQTETHTRRHKQYIPHACIKT